MKKALRILVTSLLLFALPFVLSAQVCLRHPNNGNAPGTNNHTVGSNVGAPIDGGMSILLVLALGFGVKKLRKERKFVTETRDA